METITRKKRWKDVGLLLLGLMLGAIGVLAAKSAKTKLEATRYDAEDLKAYREKEAQSYEPRSARFKTWFSRLVGLEYNEFDDVVPTNRTVLAAVIGTLLVIFVLVTAALYLVPAPDSFDVTLSPVRVWVTNDQAATPKANVTIIASGTAVEQTGAQLEYIVTDIATGQVIKTGAFEQRLYSDIGFERGPAGASYRIEVILIPQGHDPLTVSRQFTIPSAAALPTE